MEFEDIEHLETKITQLLDRHAKIKKEKDLAEKRLLLKESEFHQLKGQIRHYERERSEIRERVERILDQISRLNIP